MILRERGMGNQLSKLIGERTGFEVRHVIIGYMQRGEISTLFDRILGFKYGETTVDLVAQGKFG